jgi:hypothetical protein
LSNKVTLQEDTLGSYFTTVVFWGGTSDVSKNNSHGGLKHIVNFVENNSHMNIILVSVPRQYDLSDWSCVNSEVKTFNRKLVKHMNPYKHVTVLKVDLKREFFLLNKVCI